ncbi:MAG: hypothetical protein JNL11_16310 [Bdellovibrionaceae bacterium]|nr:hypothetical protein [Pseudobdellovibrionaceae bacterium]
MKDIVMLLLVCSFGFSYAQTSSSNSASSSVVATPSSGVEPGLPSKEQQEALKDKLAAQRDLVNSACQDEAKTAGCADKGVGRGLLKCIREHKRASKDFKISEGCKAAMKSLRDERRKYKKKKKENI